MRFSKSLLTITYLHGWRSPGYGFPAASGEQPSSQSYVETRGREGREAVVNPGLCTHKQG